MKPAASITGYLWILGAMCSIPFSSAAAADQLVEFDALLSRYVRSSPDGINRVAYAAWHRSRADRDRLDRIVLQMAAAEPERMGRDQQFAFWSNLYNALTLKVVLYAYPVRSIREIRSAAGWFDPKAWTGPWREKRVTIAGKRLSLDDIEHEILRPLFRDARVHYALNCASIGCPNLRVRVWRPDTLSRDLDEAARAFVNHPRGVHVRSDGTVHVSSIYRWFSEDFGGADAAVLRHLRAYAAPALRRQLEEVIQISGDHYDWNLNEVASGL